MKTGLQFTNGKLKFTCLKMKFTAIALKTNWCDAIFESYLKHFINI